MLGQLNIVVQLYDGFDIDLDELRLAEDFYTGIFRVDLTEDAPSKNRQNYDYVICLNTLEHVRDAASSINNLVKMLDADGTLYLKLPCRHALFAKLNKALPQNIKRAILHSIYPQKSGDGFKAYYDKSTPSEIKKILEDNGLEVQELNLIKWSSYFSFLFPLYLVWRLAACIQNAMIQDYCESFEIVAKKR